MAISNEVPNPQTRTNAAARLVGFLWKHKRSVWMLVWRLFFAWIAADIVLRVFFNSSIFPATGFYGFLMIQLNGLFGKDPSRLFAFFLFGEALTYLVGVWQDRGKLFRLLLPVHRLPKVTITAPTAEIPPPAADSSGNRSSVGTAAPTPSGVSRSSQPAARPHKG